MRHRIFIYAAVLLSLAAWPAASVAINDSEHYRLRMVTLVSGLRSPWSLAFLHDGGMIVTEREGAVRLLSRLRLDGNKVVAEERILAGLGQRIRDVRQGPDDFLYPWTDSDNGQILCVATAR